MILQIGELLNGCSSKMKHSEVFQEVKSNVTVVLQGQLWSMCLSVTWDSVAKGLIEQFEHTQR